MSCLSKCILDFSVAVLSRQVNTVQYLQPVQVSESKEHPVEKRLFL